VGGKGFKLSPGDMSKASTSMKGFSSKLTGHSSKVDSTHDQLTSKMSGDKSGFGGVFTKVISKTRSAFSDMGKQLARVTGGAGDRLDANGKSHSTNESNTEGSFKKLAEDPKPSTTKTNSSGGPSAAKPAPSGSDYKEPTKKPTDSGEDGGETKPSDAGSNDKPTAPPKQPKGSGGGDDSTKPSGSGAGGGGGDPRKPPGGGGDDDPKKPSGSGGGGKQPKPPKPPKPTDERPPRPAVDPAKAPAATTGPASDDGWRTNKVLPKPGPYKDKKGALVPTPATKHGAPPDKGRGAQVEQLDPKDPKATTTKDGLITHVADKDGKMVPVKDYVQNLSKKRAEDLENPGADLKQQAKNEGWSQKKLATEMDKAGIPPKEGTCSSLAVDLRTGSITQGVNGGRLDVVDPKNLHPLLQNNYQNLRAHDTQVTPDPNSTKHGAKLEPYTLQGKAHVSTPLNHAEVKATNELLWQRQAAGEAEHGEGYQLPASTLGEIRVDPRATSSSLGGAGAEAPCCANCNSILDGVPSYTGRYTYDGDDTRRELQQDRV
jgi:hypothetical protein